MVFSSITFLFYFLPITVTLHFFVPGKYQNLVLVLCSMFFYAWGEPRYVLLMIAGILTAYGCGRLMELYKTRKGRMIWYVCSVCVSLFALLFFKYADFILENLNRFFGLDMPLLHVSLPVGISFYTFQIISYLTDVYRGAPAEKNMLHLAVYICMFPQLIAGPIVRYEDLAHQIRMDGAYGAGRRTSFEKAAYGIRRFVTGLAKKVLLADQLGQLCQIFRLSEDKSVLFYWIYAVSCSLYIYFDFSGYSDMAVGLGSIFGFRFPENFNYPFISTSITEFWRRWHMSLGSWFRDYVYIPLGGSRKGRRRQIVCIFIVWILTGLWHGAEWNFVLWGLYFAILLCIEKVFIKKRTVFSRLYFLFLISISFVVFHAENVSQVAADLRGLTGAGGIAPVSGEALYYLRSYALTLAAAILGATPFFRYVSGRMQGCLTGRRTAGLLEPIWLSALMIVISAYLVDHTFQPFLYFRF